MKAIKRQEKVKSMAIKLFRLNYARDLCIKYHLKQDQSKLKIFGNHLT